MRKGCTAHCADLCTKPRRAGGTSRSQQCERARDFIPDGRSLRELVAGAFAATCATGAAALLIALDHDAKYRSVDFKWFRARRRRFVYVDRIVVSGRDRGRGLATCLYRDLFERAREASLRAHFGPARGCGAREDPPRVREHGNGTHGVPVGNDFGAEEYEGHGRR